MLEHGNLTERVTREMRGLLRLSGQDIDGNLREVGNVLLGQQHFDRADIGGPVETIEDEV
jgi:hypothetical protein